MGRRGAHLRLGLRPGRRGAARQGPLAPSTGDAEESYRPDRYNRYFFDAFLPAYEQPAALCGMRFLPPLLLHGAHHASAADVEAHAGVYRDRLGGYPDWPELADLPAFDACDVPASARPAPENAEVEPDVARAGPG